MKKTTTSTPKTFSSADLKQVTGGATISWDPANHKEIVGSGTGK